MMSRRVFGMGRATGRAAVAVLLLSGVVAGGAGAQDFSVAGTVRDEAGQAVGGAQVVLLPGGRQALTDGRGRFRLGAVAAGRYRIHVAVIGYAPVEREVRVGVESGTPAAAAGDGADLEIRLVSTPLALGGIEVTATPTGRAPSAVVQATWQLSGRALERELGGTVAQTLRNQPGVAVRSNGPAAALPIVRGLTGDRVLVLQDGQRTADLSGSADDHGLTLDPLLAQRVEVVRGPATLLYGNNAMGGVVNVISGDLAGGRPLAPELMLAARTESAYPGYAASARAAAPLGGAWSLAASAGVRRAGDMRIGADANANRDRRLPNTDMSSRNGSLTLARASAGWRASVTARGYGFAYGLPVAPGTEPVDLRGSRMEAAGRADVELPGELLPALRADATLQRYEHDEIDDAGAVQQRFALGTGTLNLLVRQGTAGPLRDGAWGASLLLKRYAPTGPAALIPAADSRAAGVFGFEELGLGGRFALQLGGRADRYVISSRGSRKFGPGVERRFDALSGSIGLVVTLHEGVTAGVTAARSFRAPTVEELFSAAPHAGTGSVELGDAALREERGRGLDAVLRVRTGRVSAQFAAYHNRIADYIHPTYQGDTVVGGSTLPVYRYAASDAVLRGVEGSLEVALTRSLVLGLRGDRLHAREVGGPPLSYMPPPRAGVALRWDSGRFSLGGDVHHEGAQRRTGAAGEPPTDAHAILRIDAGARVRALGREHSITLRVDNLTDVLHREATSRTADFAPAAGRNVALGYRVRL